MLLSLYSIIAFVYWACLSLYLMVNGRKIKSLSSIGATVTKPRAAVVIIIAVRNEEYALREALISVCNLRYSNYRVLVINDRSTDNTSQILTELTAVYNNLSVKDIDTLPAGWLGKNHALYTGFQSSHQEYMLFTDADVIFEKDVLSKAMNYCVTNHLDHLTILPGIISPSPVLNSVIATFVIMLTALQRPWAAKVKTSKAFMGVGAFNLVKRDAYVRAGTHQAIAMRPDDDLKLAKYIKAAGGVADVLYGMKELQVEWYTSVREFIKGLMKNVFSGFNYNLFKAMAAAIATLLLFVFPLPVMLIFGDAWQRSFGIGIFLFQLMLYGCMPGSGGKWWHALMSIYAGAVITYVMVKSAVITVYNRGIYWRETFYSLAELRKHK